MCKDTLNPKLPNWRRPIDADDKVAHQLLVMNATDKPVDVDIVVTGEVRNGHLVPTDMHLRVSSAEKSGREFLDGLIEESKTHPPSNECTNPECMVCGVRDCPHQEPLHHDKDGCPACYQDDLRNMRRASGDCICETCGKEYRKHPHSEHRDWQDEPYLHRLCDGSLVKL